LVSRRRAGKTFPRLISKGALLTLQTGQLRAGQPQTPRFRLSILCEKLEHRNRCNNQISRAMIKLIRRSQKPDFDSAPQHDQALVIEAA
jgi:hypothetical protein